MSVLAKHLRPVEEVTNILFVGNAGPAVGLPAESIERLCVHLCPTGTEVPDLSKSFIFISFETEEQAAAAKELLSLPEVAGRQLAVKFAKRHPKFRDGPAAIQTLPVCTDAAALGVPGLHMFTDFVTEAEETALLNSVQHCQWRWLAKRSVLHFGYAFEYLTRTVSTEGCCGPMPLSCEHIIKRMEALPHVERLDQLTVNKYPAGVGLSPHVDAHSAFTGPVISLSLGSSAVMEFRREGVRKCLFLPRRSLVVMAGECRYAWCALGQPTAVFSSTLSPAIFNSRAAKEHYIPHRKSDVVDGATVPREAFRTSFTFRQARGHPCHCAYPDMCDSQESPLPPTRKLQLLQAQGQTPPTQTPPTSAQSATAAAATSAGAKELAEGPGQCGDGAVDGSADMPGPASDACTACVSQLKGGAAGEREEGDEQLRRLEHEHVHRVYDAIAPHFSATRFAVWPAVRRFIEGLPSGAIVADVGCGNGKYIGLRSDIAELASDPCEGLVRSAAQRLQSGSGAAPGAFRAADVLLADGMGPPYRCGSCDAALCIAVLHHISSPGRRVRFLERLRDVLRVGGRAIVTVWATQQENPDKTVRRWTPMQPGAADGAQGGGGDHAEPTVGTPGEHGSQAEGAGADADNYFVPWHLPFHRAEAYAAAVRAREHDAPAAAEPRDGDGGRETAVTGPAVGEVDARKGTIVFKRYYHLFGEGEMEALVGQVTGVTALDCFYDASNWVILFERVS